MNYYVDCNSQNFGKGTKDCPFLTISEAANLAKPGDEVIVSAGVYREYVNPKTAGTVYAPIVFRSIEKGKAVITGAEIVNNWENLEGDVWVARISNEIFGDYNPYTTLVSGDWFMASYIAHTGEVYLNDKAMYEVTSLEKVKNPVIYKQSWDADFSVYTWYAEQDESTNETIIYANFHGLNPNEECVEINVRRNCFYPSKEGVGYITVSGFTITKAATQWAPPTAYQEGMVGPHWSKGWIIEDCDISHSKCAGISLGKYYQPTNDNKWLKTKVKDGAQTERECIMLAQLDGWTKENIGSHIIRRCNIHDCGQAGIVGHLGCVFSIIEDCDIHNINNRQNLAGAEIAGIKLHAAIDVQIRRNKFHFCTRGLWLDWQAQGTRVSQNLFYDNTLPKDENANTQNIDGLGEDIFIEVSHGPTLVDNNILLSDHALKLPTQGIAVVHNFIAGSLTAVGRGVTNGTDHFPSPRYTPYHIPHRTEVAGFMTILHGDARFYNNIFVQKPMREGLVEIMNISHESEWSDSNVIAGLMPYENYPSVDEFNARFEGYCNHGSGNVDKYYDKLPVSASGNAYFNGAVPLTWEENAYVNTTDKLEFKLENDKLSTNAYDYIAQHSVDLINSDTLGFAFESEQRFENPDGTDIIFDTDFDGIKRSGKIVAGPFAK